VHVFRKRLPMMHRLGWSGPKASSATAYAWLVWDADHTGPTELTGFNRKEREVNRRERRKADKKLEKVVATEFSQEIHRRIVERFPDVDSRNENMNTRLYVLMKSISMEILTHDCPGCRARHAAWVLKQANKIADIEFAAAEQAMGFRENGDGGDTHYH